MENASGNKNRKSWNYVGRSLICGGLAGGVAKTVSAPLDRVKILFQGQNRSFAQWVGTYTGPFKAVRYIYQQNGIPGLYRGHGAMLARILPYAACNYAFYEQWKRVLMRDDERSSHSLKRLLAGSLAGAGSVTLTYPLDYVRSRLAYQQKSHAYRGIIHTVTKTVRTEGIRGLYKGFGPTLAGMLPYAGMSFYSYESLRLLTAPFLLDEQGEFPVIPKLALGALAGMIAQTSAYPFDVLRRKYQLQGLSSNIPKFRSVFHAIQVVYKANGWRGFFVGLSINYMKVGPSTATSFTVYEFMKKRLDIA